MDRLKAYNEEFDTWDDLRIIVKNFMNDINNEISQATYEKPIDMFKREKEHLLPKPNLDTLYSYISDQEDKTVKVNRESMIKYEGRKYSVPIKYIGERMSVVCDDYNNLRIYYNGNFVISHPKTTRPYNYTLDTAYEILKSDAMKHNSDDEILSYVKKNIMQLDNKFGDD